MQLVSFYENDDGPTENRVRIGTGTVDQVKAMVRPSCYLCLHYSRTDGTPTPWMRLGRAVWDENAQDFQEIPGEGLEDHGAPMPFCLLALYFIGGALSDVRAYMDHVSDPQGEQWFAVDTGTHLTTPVTELQAWDALALPGSHDLLACEMYLCVKAPAERRNEFFDRLQIDCDEDRKMLRERNAGDG